jgi:uncharacterized membrane protein YhaH (DUF805 family)
MRGEIISVDASTGGGLISGDDGSRYAFTAAATRGAVRTGNRVDFLGLDGVANDVVPLALSAPSYASASSGAAYDFGRAMFSFNGRLRRSHFWISWAILFTVGLLLSWIPFLGVVVSLALIWPHLAIGTKRLHDMGRSGWLIAIPWVAMLVGWIVMVAMIGVAAVTDPMQFENAQSDYAINTIGAAFVVLGLSWLLAVGFWLWIGITDSRPGRNRFGPNPKYPAQDQADVFT